MNLTKLTATTILALSIAFPAGNALSQDKDKTVDRNLNQAEQNLDNAGENLKDAGGALGNSIKNTGEAAGQGLENTAEAAGKEISETAVAIEQKSNWGWLGLLGLLGLFGLAGRNKTTKVVEHQGDLEPLDRNDPTTYVQ